MDGWTAGCRWVPELSAANLTAAVLGENGETQVAVFLFVFFLLFFLLAARASSVKMGTFLRREQSIVLVLTVGARCRKLHSATVPLRYALFSCSDHCLHHVRIAQLP